MHKTSSLARLVILSRPFFDTKSGPKRAAGFYFQFWLCVFGLTYLLLMFCPFYGQRHLSEATCGIIPTAYRVVKGFCDQFWKLVRFRFFSGGDRETAVFPTPLLSYFYQAESLGMTELASQS